MSKTHPEWDIQGKRLSKVLDYLKKIEDKIPNISQKAEYSFYSLMPSDKMDKLFNNNITFEKDISELKQSYHRLEEKINNISSKIPKEEMTAIKYEMQIGLDKIKKLSNS